MQTAYNYINHYLVPHHSNNHKAKTLHSKVLFAFVALILILQITLTYIVPTSGVGILGYASNISTNEVIALTNQKRQEAGLSPLQNNAQLQEAARAKGEDMLQKDYWAHVAPDGTEPWKFFVDVGYEYRYAGENLAKDFTNPTSAIDAWMASPTHKDNMLSAKYSEIGIAVVEGDLNGVDTTIIVQLFGSRYVDIAPEPVAAVTRVPAEPKLPTQAPVVLASPEPVLTVVSTPIPIPALVIQQPVVAADSQESSDQVLVSPFLATKTLSLFVTGFLLVVLVVDAVVISRRRIARISGRTFAHMAFIGTIVAIALVLKAGRII